MSIELLKAYQKEHDLSQAKVASQLGVSPSVISQYLQGKYEGDTDTLEKKIKELAERVAESTTAIKDGFVKTLGANLVLDTCKKAHTYHSIRLVIGEAGLGKSRAIAEYAKLVENVVLVRVNPTFSVKVLLNELCQKLGLTASRNNNDNFNALVGKLAGSSRLIIVDEAEQLNYKCLEIIRNLHDLTGVGVILAGMPRLKANLQGKSLEFRQLYSRVEWVCDLGNVLNDDDIGKLAKSSLGTDKFNALLIKHAKGNARRLSKLIKGAEQIASQSGVAIDEVVIEKASKMLIG